MGALMSTIRNLCSSLLLVVVLMAIGSPAAAQLVDRVGQRTSQQTQEVEQPAPAKPPARKMAAPAKSETGPTEGVLNPPRWLAKPPPARERAEPAPPPEERNSLLSLFLSLLGVGVVLFVAERARGWITTNIPLRRVLGALVFVLRLVGLGLLLAIVLELVPGGQEWILWALVVLALVVGWSVRDLFADVVAGAVLAAERRVKKGMWVSGDGFQGTVEGRSLRATWLRDGQGHRLTVPNRAMVGAPMVYDSGADAEHEVVVRLEGYDDAGRVRLALTDAVLSSPWVLAGATPVVLRDPADPVVWRVRTKLLEPRFSVHFEGELLERVEDLLRHEPDSEERETVPSSSPPAN
jgi:small-conductance mechanosensitive channel